MRRRARLVILHTATCTLTSLPPVFGGRLFQKFGHLRHGPHGPWFLATPDAQMFTGSARQHARRRATACTLRVAALLRAALTLWAVGAVPAPPAGGVWVEVLSPRDGAALYADESARITYRTSSLPAGALVRLSINGKEALRNPNTEVTVDVPGLIAGRHEVAVEVLDAGGAPLADRRVRFEVRTGYSWVAKYVLLADEAAAATCSAADVCTFLIDARGDGSTPSSGHFFRVRLVGPAIVMGSIHELNSTGVYQVTYRAVDAGVYSMSVVLLHASNTGIADPGEGIPRQFLDQHIAASPLQVRVTPSAHPVQPPPDSSACTAGGTGQGSWARGCMAQPPFHAPFHAPAPLCPGMRRYARQSVRPLGPPWAQGRWVHRHVCEWQGDWCGGVESDRVDQADAPQFAQDPWIWVPHGLPACPALSPRLASVGAHTSIHCPRHSRIGTCCGGGRKRQGGVGRRRGGRL